ncbi:EAL domain-containing protein [Pontibacillus marinus]|uniref:EAL domain-containing protein n=1 Tax=Pontibacillus marinus BH030004 = DSM 16465 TaxID=1385511 RepID=A0A0A5FX74_9BACI|nr:EAL domain-containing protein [Pontibacillus marinus]KGX85451.1 hypothetical protein N783_14695 [Pontibacillus marinus BH030004 = DSM 16465]
MLSMVNTERKNTKAYQLFSSWLDKKAFSTHYQPIVSLQKGSIYGYEALTRFPQNQIFSHPGELFSYASDVNHLYQLEKITRELAIQSVHQALKTTETLWINLSPEVVHDEGFSTGYTRSLLDYFGLRADQIVFEITERSAIRDYPAFKNALEHYRKQGFMIAIDDAGAGYSSLEAITELHPDFIKVDRSLIHNIDQSITRQYMLEALLQLTDKIGAEMIAEGVETQKELEWTTKLGVPYAQGYFLARPDYPIPRLNEQCLGLFQSDIDHYRVEFTFHEETTMKDLMNIVAQFEGRFDTSWVRMKISSFHSLVPFTEIVQFICNVENRPAIEWDEPVWEYFMGYRAQVDM